MLHTKNELVHAFSSVSFIQLQSLAWKIKKKIVCSTIHCQLHALMIILAVLLNEMETCKHEGTFHNNNNNIFFCCSIERHTYQFYTSIFIVIDFMLLPLVYFSIFFLQGTDSVLQVFIYCSRSFMSFTLKKFHSGFLSLVLSDSSTPYLPFLYVLPFFLFGICSI